jgi:hypothetical protein
MRGIAAGLAIGAALCVPSVAFAENVVYEGHIKGNDAATFNLTFVKTGDKLKLQFFEGTGSGFDLACDDGPHTLNLSSGPFKGAQVRDDEFDARQDAGSHHVRVSGKLRKQGKAKGTFSHDFTSETWGACTTDTLDWVAEKS